MKIPYEMIVTSSSRPHLLAPTLESHLAMVDQKPERVIVHEDSRLPETLVQVQEIVHTCGGTFLADAPPVRMGLSLLQLLKEARTEHVLYLQDDFVAVRPIPIARALPVLLRYRLTSIRYNKRATMKVKETWRGPWVKEEFRLRMREGAPRCADGGAFQVPGLVDWGQPANCVVCKAPREEHTPDPADYETLTISDHLGFQTSLWRVDPILSAVEWCADRARVDTFRRGVAEDLINRVLDGEEGEVPGVVAPVGAPDPQLPDIRARYQKTFLWGPIGEDLYVRHIGPAARDWAGGHAREPEEPGAAERAWREIAEARRKYPPPPLAGAD